MNLPKEEEKEIKLSTEDEQAAREKQRREHELAELQQFEKQKEMVFLRHDLNSLVIMV